MRAVVLHSPGDLRIEELPDPVLPRGGLVVRTAFTGVCGSDVRNWRHGSGRLTGPQVLGHETVGIVVASDAAAYPVGTRVAVCPGVPCGRCALCGAGRHNLCRDRDVLGYDFPGGMAESFAVPAASIAAACVNPLPSELSLRDAVLAEPLHTVVNGQDLARIGLRDRVLVLGLGAIGTLHAMHALSLGAQVLAVDLRQERVDAARGLLGPGTAELLRPDALGADWDVVVIAAGSAAAADLAFRVAGRAGRILAFAGLPPADATVPVPMNLLHYEQLELIGAFGGTPSTYARAVTWLAASDLPLDRLVTHEFGIDDALAAFENVERGVGLKTVLRGPGA